MIVGRFSEHLSNASWREVPYGILRIVILKLYIFQELRI